MTRRLTAGLALALGAVLAAASATAQDAPSSDTPAPPSTQTPTPPAPAPPASPPESAPAPPPAEPAPVQPTPPADTGQAPPSTETPATGQAQPGAQQLPDVEVIQEQPKPAPAPQQQVAPKPKKTPPTAQQQPAPPQPTPPVATTTPTEPSEIVNYGPPPENFGVRMSPVSGSEIPLKKVPQSVGLASGADIEKDGSAQVQQALQARVPGIVVTDIAGSGFRADVSYRGFDASSVSGRPQGIAVYQNGVRINEAFGDTVNWDLLPSNSIADITVVGSNPVFGLNAIGGAISIVTKDGFTYQGGEIDVMGGSFGRRQVGIQAGANSGGAAAYMAAEYVAEDGFRDFSEAAVKRFFGDVGLKGSSAEFHVNLTAADSLAGVVTAAPVQLLDQSWALTFTNPQTTDIKLLMPTISGRVQATETLSFSGVGYYRHLKQRVLDGNLSEAQECSFDSAILCLSDDGVEEQLADADGNPIATPGGPVGSLERINTDADSYGGALQAVEKSKLFGRSNQFLVGVSYDHGNVKYNTSSEVGVIGPKFVVTGTGEIVAEPDDLGPRDLTSENDYGGVYFSDTLDVTERLALTVGGRYNFARIVLEDLTGNFPELNQTNDFDRFNPMAGATYQLAPGITLYGSYSQANRAPTAAELACADPENPCLIESFLTDDPPLEQVVSSSWEAGLRGEHKSRDGQLFTWSAGYFRTLNTNDILNVAATATGRGYFLNAGDTLRQGIELAAAYQSQRFSVYGSYAFIDATFRDDLVLPAPNTPNAETCPGTDPADDINCNFVTPGDSLPGIPRHRFKAGFDYWITNKWKFGSDLITTSGQYFFGDEANSNPKLSGYTRVDLHTSYDLNDNIEIYGLLKNVLDQHYGLYGTFFSTDDANDASSATGQTFTDPRSITPAAPVAAYGGIRIKF